MVNLKKREQKHHESWKIIRIKESGKDMDAQIDGLARIYEILFIYWWIFQ